MPRLWLIAVILALASPYAAAHKSSDAYLLLDVGAERLELRADIALRDLDEAVDLDADFDGQLTWGEVKAAWPRIEAYVRPRIAIAGCSWNAMPIAPTLERRSDGVYAVLRLTAPCRLAEAPSIGYALFAEIDPTHRGLARVVRPGASPALLVLDPARSALPAVAGASARAASGGVATSASPPSRWQFLEEGVRHILGGYDHVLFLICLLLPAVLRRTPAGWQPVDRIGQAIWPVVAIATAFTVAHSITLVLASLKLVSLPASLVEPAIAVTIVLAAADNLRPIFPLPRLVVAFVFGLIHGFGFAGVLAELELPASDFAWALFQFNLGLEVGQVMVVVVLTAFLFAIRKWRSFRPVIVVGGSLLAIAIATLWFVERTANVSILPF